MTENEKHERCEYAWELYWNATPAVRETADRFADDFLQSDEYKSGERTDYDWLEAVEMALAV